MEIKAANTLLKDLRNPRQNKQLKFVEKVDQYKIDTRSGEGEQGAEGKYYEIYSILNTPNLFLQINYYTNSYGYGSYIDSVQFAAPTEKTIVTYQPV